MRSSRTIPSDRQVVSATIVEMFEAQASRVPDLVALQWERGSLTYRNVRRQVHALAQVLVSCGVEPGRTVVVAMPRGAGAIVGILAVWTVGATYLPIDPELPRVRAQLMKAETRPCCVLRQPDPCNDEWFDNVFEGLPLVTVDELGSALGADTGAPVEIHSSDRLNRPSWNTPAYILYTSGSTGRPKGVLVEHGAIANYIIWLRNYLAISELDRVFLQTALSFDVSIGQCFAPLVSGSCVFLARPGGERDPSYVRDVLQGQGITIVHFVPSALRLFTTAFPAIRLPSLRALVTSGERLAEDLENECIRDHGFVVHNLYGPTEASVDATYHRCRGDGGDPPIGRSVSHATVRLLDPDLQQIDQPGVTGEIFIGGDGLARGYVGQPGQTAQRFIADPYGPAGSYMYRTGDRGRWNQQRELEYIDRVDNQVQVRGHRVELGEIEAALRRSVHVRDAVVVAHQSVRRGKTFLVAFLAVGPPSSIDRSMIITSARQAVVSTLPTYMAPARYETVQEFPLNGSGKTDRKSLADSFRDCGPVTPVKSTPTDRPPAVHELAAEVLCEAELDESLSFFQLGGDSIDAIEMVSAARRDRLDLRLEDIIAGRPLGDVAQIVNERPFLRVRRYDQDSMDCVTKAVPGPSVSQSEWDRITDNYTSDLSGSIASDRVRLEELWPLSPLQEGLIAQSLYDDTAPDIYTVQVCVEVDSPLESVCVREAVASVARAHPALRSAFVLDRPDEPLQAVMSEVSTEVEVVRLPADAEQSGALADWLLADRQRRFDLMSPPLYRFSVLRLGEERNCLVFTHHHALLDGWSVNIVVADVLRICQGGEPVAEGVSPRPFALWARNQGGPVADRAWRRALGGSDGLVLAADTNAVPAAGETWSEELSLDLSERDTALVFAGAAAIGVTPATLIAGAWAAALGRATERTDLAHGYVVSGRECPVASLDRAVGLLMNTIPVAARWYPGESWARFLSRLQIERAELAPYWYQPLREVRRAVGSGAHFDTCLVFGTYPTIEQIAPEIANTIKSTAVAETAEFPLMLHVQLRPIVRLRFTYWPRIISRLQCEKIGGYVHEMINKIIDSHGTSGPTGPVEEDAESSAELVSNVFEEVLRCEIPGIDSDFFELGGDSILASRVTNRIKALTGTRVPTKVVFDAATPRQIAAYLDHR